MITKAINLHISRNFIKKTVYSKDKGSININSQDFQFDSLQGC